MSWKLAELKWRQAVRLRERSYEKRERQAEEGRPSSDEGVELLRSEECSRSSWSIGESILCADSPNSPFGRDRSSTTPLVDRPRTCCRTSVNTDLSPHSSLVPLLAEVERKRGVRKDSRASSPEHSGLFEEDTTPGPKSDSVHPRPQSPLDFLCTRNRRPPGQPQEQLLRSSGGVVGAADFVTSSLGSTTACRHAEHFFEDRKDLSARSYPNVVGETGSGTSRIPLLPLQPLQEPVLDTDHPQFHIFHHTITLVNQDSTDNLHAPLLKHKFEYEGVVFEIINTYDPLDECPVTSFRESMNQCSDQISSHHHSTFQLLPPADTDFFRKIEKECTPPKNREPKEEKTMQKGPSKQLFSSYDIAHDSIARGKTDTILGLPPEEPLPLTPKQSDQQHLSDLQDQKPSVTGSTQYTNTQSPLGSGQDDSLTAPALVEDHLNLSARMNTKTLSNLEEMKNAPLSQAPPSHSSGLQGRPKEVEGNEDDWQTVCESATNDHSRTGAVSALTEVGSSLANMSSHESLSSNQANEVTTWGPLPNKVVALTHPACVALPHKYRLRRDVESGQLALLPDYSFSDDGSHLTGRESSRLPQPLCTTKRQPQIAALHQPHSQSDQINLPVHTNSTSLQSHHLNSSTTLPSTMALTHAPEKGLAPASIKVDEFALAEMSTDENVAMGITAVEEGDKVAYKASESISNYSNDGSHQADTPVDDHISRSNAQFETAAAPLTTMGNADKHTVFGMQEDKIRSLRGRGIQITGSSTGDVSTEASTKNIVFSGLSGATAPKTSESIDIKELVPALRRRPLTAPEVQLQHELGKQIVTFWTCVPFLGCFILYNIMHNGHVSRDLMAKKSGGKLVDYHEEEREMAETHLLWSVGGIGAAWLALMAITTWLAIVV